MGTIRFTLLGIVAVMAAVTPAVVSASDPANASKNENVAPTTTVSTNQFATLKGVKTVLMSPRELDAVKGQHVHFITDSNDKVHLAGDVKTENNWSNEWGGTDGKPVAPSYHGLCVAHGNGSIFIPTGPPGTPVTLQCPAGS